MSLIEWRDAFSVGVPAVDHEHRELIDTINQLNDIAIAGGSAERIIAFLGEIYAQISAHFALEERVMREAQYDELAAHKAEHEALLDTLRDIMDSVEDGRDYDEQALGKKLDEWFSVHFRTQDARLHGKLG